MLALKRRLGETIHIGDDIVITIMNVGLSVKVGIEAPRNVKILRGELLSRATAESDSEPPECE